MIDVKVKIDGTNSLADLKSVLLKKSKIILFGNSHGFFNDLELQEAILREINAEFYIYEMLEETNILSSEDYLKFLSRPDSEDFSIISKIEEIRPTILLAEKYNLKVIGCDIKDMGRENNEFLNKTEHCKEEEKEEENLLLKREAHQAKIIEDYSKKTDKTIFVSLGAYHLRKDSLVLKMLNSEDILVCYPSFKGLPCFGPEEGMTRDKIKYVIQLKKDYLM